MKSEFILAADNVYLNLRENEKTFASEAAVISRAKCMLMRNEPLEDFYANGIYVRVYGDNGIYELYYQGYRLEIYVYEKQIVDFYLFSQ
ncbi:MAG: hypothetical protein J5365_02225 [Erysipelotrichaceae bacterium]|nr:hypothetical protein [Erysipelotrichaceae bacterium]